MKTYTQPQLFDAANDYAKREAALAKDAKAAVVQWKYADEDMFGLFPLFDAIDFRGSTKWTPAKRRWLDEKPQGFFHQHGFDAQGKVRIIERSNGIVTLFIRAADEVDEIVYGSRGTSLKRHILASGRPVACYDYNLDPHQYSLEAFEYVDDRLVRSVEHSWWVSDGVWKEATWKTTCTYEHDAAGLLRAYRDMGERLGGKQLVYVRPNAGSLANRPPSRRPIVAYTRTDEIQSDAYGLEMSIDNEWPVDTILFTPPDLLMQVTRDTGVTTMGTVYAGVSSMPPASELAKVHESGGTWVLVDARGPAAAPNSSAALKAGLNVLLANADVAAIRTAMAELPRTIDAARVVIAFADDEACSPDAAQAIAATLRGELKKHDAEFRIVIAAPITKDNIMDFIAQPDIDGVLRENGDFEWAMEVLVPIALNSAS